MRVISGYNGYLLVIPKIIPPADGEVAKLLTEENGEERFISYSGYNGPALQKLQETICQDFKWQRL